MKNLTALSFSKISESLLNEDLGQILISIPTAGQKVSANETNARKIKQQPIRQFREITPATATLTLPSGDPRRAFGISCEAKISASLRFRLGRREMCLHREMMTATTSLTRPFSDPPVPPDTSTGQRREQQLSASGQPAMFPFRRLLFHKSSRSLWLESGELVLRALVLLNITKIKK
jgi:hypothetical protein